MTCFPTLLAFNLLCTRGRAPENDASNISNTVFPMDTELSVPEKAFFWHKAKQQMVAELSTLSRIFDFLSRMPSAKEIFALKATQEEDRFTYLSDRSNAGNATEEEEDELEKILLAQHLMIIAKANALGVLKRAQN